MHSILQRFVSIFLLAALASCAQTSSTLPDDVGGIRLGVAAAREQARISFDAANALALAQGIDRKLSLPETTVSEEDFPMPISVADAAAWNSAFGVLDTYCAALQSLVDPKRASDTGDAISELAKTLNGPTIDAKIPASLSGLFSTLGQALIQAEGDKTALAAMRKTDTAFNGVVSRMADAIGASPSNHSSLQFVVKSNWTESLLPTIENRYLRLKLGDPARKQILSDYTAAMVSRDAQLANLSQLHDSLLALGAAHAAAARGSPGDALYWIARINTWLDDIKERAASTQKNESTK